MMYLDKYRTGNLSRPASTSMRDVSDAARATISVHERMDRLKLVVGRRHAYQRVKAVIRMYESLPIQQALSRSAPCLGRTGR